MFKNLHHLSRIFPISIIILCSPRNTFAQNNETCTTSRCDCLKPNSTIPSCAPPNVDNLSITLNVGKIEIKCRDPNSPTNEDVLAFDARYLNSIDNGTPLTLAYMIDRCRKTNAREVSFTLDSNKFNHFSASDEILHNNKLKYLRFKNAKDNGVNVMLLEKGFLTYGSQLTTLIVNNLKVPSLKDYLRNLSHVETLDLSSNGIETLEDAALRNLSNLKQLILRNNKISVVHLIPNVTYVDLSVNRIRFLNKSLFVTAPNMEFLNLSNNHLRSIEEDTFQTISKLQHLDLSQNMNLTFKAGTFSNLSALKSLNISGCQMSKVPISFFEKCEQLLVLNISNNRILHLEDDSLASLRNLQLLDLSYNSINSLSENLLLPLKELKSLYVSSNKLTMFNSQVFINAQNLQLLDLNNNLIQKFRNASTGFRAVDIMLKNNSIDKFPCHLLINVISLKHLDLSYNNITYVQLEKEKFPNQSIYIEVDLSHNNIIDFNTTKDPGNKSWKIMLDLSYNRLQCNCLHYQIEQASPLQPLTAIIQITSGEDLCYTRYPHDNCPFIHIPRCPNECSCYYTRSDNAINVNCSHRNLTVFPKITGLSADRYEHNQTIIMLHGNMLNTQEQIRVKDYTNVSRLDLSGNYIEELTWLPQNFSVLKLDNNHLTTLSSEIVEVLTKNRELKNVSLKDNPWNCDCRADPLKKFLIQFNNIKVKYSEVTCQGTKEFLINTKGCEKANLLKVALPLGLAIPLAVISAIAALYYKFRISIKVYLYSKNWCLWCVAEEELDKDKTYDVFISYSHKDESFVHEDLMPELESGEHPFKVCVHYRDWMPGEFISQQIINSVLDSRRTLVVLSNNFMESVWGKMEFRTAHLQAINEGRARVIVVLYGDLDQETLDDEIKTYLKTNTYVEWKDPWFWSKLKYALPHSKSRKRYMTQHSRESFHLK
ncbi:protein toll-like [Euwallacea fornicatus]|uniref:protein toll-like n=1 Tax=Euwallacea fornicatus TaxID=995702 RepID=UPI00338FB44E